MMRPAPFPAAERVSGVQDGRVAPARPDSGRRPAGSRFADDQQWPPIQDGGLLGGVFRAEHDVDQDTVSAVDGGTRQASRPSGGQRDVLRTLAARARVLGIRPESGMVGRLQQVKGSRGGQDKPFAQRDDCTSTPPGGRFERGQQPVV